MAKKKLPVPPKPKKPISKPPKDKMPPSGKDRPSKNPRNTGTTSTGDSVETTYVHPSY